MGDAEIEGRDAAAWLASVAWCGGDERNKDVWLRELALCKLPARAPGVALNRLRQKEAAGGC